MNTPAKIICSNMVLTIFDSKQFMEYFQHRSWNFREQKQHPKTKYTCSSYDLNAWVKSSAPLGCLKCTTISQEVVK